MKLQRTQNTAVPAPRVWAWAWGGLLAGMLGASLAWAPASLLARLVTGFSEGRVSLSQTRGTVWAGSAELALTGGAGSTDLARLPGRVEWRLAPAWPGLAVWLRADCCMATASEVRLLPRWQGGQLTLGAVNASFPLEVLAGLGTPWNTIQPQGALSVQTSGIDIQWALGRWSLSGHATLDTGDLTVRLSTLRPIGRYRLQLTGAEPPRLSLETLSGALLLKGQGQWSGGQWRFEGEASAKPPYEEALSNLLNIVGRRNGARSIIHLG